MGDSRIGMRIGGEMLEAGCWRLDAGGWMLEARCRMRTAERNAGTLGRWLGAVNCELRTANRELISDL
jgi:hypothetical protein